MNIAIFLVFVKCNFLLSLWMMSFHVVMFVDGKHSSRRARWVNQDDSK